MVIDSPLVGPKDRLLSTLLYALAVHLVLILGLQFDLSLTDTTPDQPTLDITLVPVKDDAPPEKADFLAQGNQQGGGDRDERAKPTTVLQADQRIAAEQPVQFPFRMPVNRSRLPSPKRLFLPRLSPPVTRSRPTRWRKTRTRGHKNYPPRLCCARVVSLHACRRNWRSSSRPAPGGPVKKSLVHRPVNTRLRPTWKRGAPK